MPRRVRPAIFRLTIPHLLLALIGGGCEANRSHLAPQPVEASAVFRERYPHRLAAAKELFYAAVAGDRPALPRSEQMFEELGGATAADPEVVAYMGAVRLLEAARAPFPWDKAVLGREGLALEDRAVAMAPDDLEVRFLRGVTSYELPRFMGRWNSAVADLTRVAQVAEHEADAGRLDRRAAAADLDYYGKILEQKYDAPGAIAAWRAAVRLNPDSPGGRDAAKHLAEHQVRSSS